MTAPEKGPRQRLEIRPFAHPARFLELQRGFYRNDPNFVPPMASAEAWQLDPRKNPFFRHADVGLFAAFVDGRCVGRISTTRDRVHDEFHGDRVGFFGHFEAIDGATTQALVDHAAAWCRARGADELRGPVDLSTNNRCGLLVEGQPGPPILMMPHNPPSYAGWLEATGLAKAKDLLALWGTSDGLDKPRIGKLVDHLARRSSATVRRLDMRAFDRECEVLWRLYEKIWEKNWGFVPMPRDEFLAQARDLKKVANPALLHIAEVAGEPIAFAVALPDVNVATKACNGRLFPFGWWKFLSALKATHVLRVLTLGVLPEYRSKGIDMLLMHRVMTDGESVGFHACEASWILEDNRAMLGPLETMGFRPWRRYRIYSKSLR
ncbi:MAG: GNAT family N-acetyltransferase [Planctomycetes bacterium]|nr:GNAT family N-acetyltransferase [Planctomycetota bacterium]